MLSTRFKPWDLIPFSYKYAKIRLQKRPVLVHFEVTMRCNARCSFCDYWKTSPDMKAKELNSFVEAARHFDPMLITWTGGEPLLRQDLEELVGSVDRAIHTKYTTLITHGLPFPSVKQSVSMMVAGIFPPSPLYASRIASL